MKNSYKRIICLILSLILCFGAAVSAAENFDAQTEEISENAGPIGENLQKAMYFLREFGIIADYYDYNIDITEEITRAEFVYSAAKLLNIPTNDNNTTHFYDVPPTHYAALEINAMCELGFISGVGNNRFEPENYIDYNAACKILLDIMNYGGVAELAGGYPNGYRRIANDLKLTKGTTASTILTRGDMLLLLFAAMDTPSYDNFNSDGGETLLEMYYEASFSKGIVQGSKKVSINGTALKDYDSVEINGKTYKSKMDLADFIGQEIEFIVFERGNEDGLVTCARSTERFSVIDIKADKFERFDDTTYKLYYKNENGSIRSLQLKRGLSLIYNGGLITNNVSDRIKEGCDLKIIETNDGYSIVIARKKKNYVVKNLDTVNEVIFNAVTIDTTMLSFNIQSENREYVSIKKDTGEEIGVGDIPLYSVVSVYESYYDTPATCGDYVEIIVSTDKEKGIVEKIDTDNGIAYVTISGTDYQLWDKTISSLFNIGANSTVYLDYEGHISYIETILEDSFAAYLIDGKYKRRDDVLNIVLLKEDGTIATLSCAQKVKLDGVRYKGEAEKLFDALKELDNSGNPVFKQQLALIRVDDNDNITEIDTADPLGEEGTLIMVTSSGSMTLDKDNYKYISDNTGKVVVYDNNTKIFGIPNEATTDVERFKLIKSMGEYFDQGSHSTEIQTYKTTHKTASFIKYIVVETKSAKLVDQQPCPLLYEKTVTRLDDDDEICKVIIGYRGNSPTEIVVKDETMSNVQWKKNGSSWSGGGINQLKKGMVIRTTIKSNGDLESINVIYDPNDSDTSQFHDIDVTIPNQKCRIGYVEDAENGLVTIKSKSPSSTAELTMNCKNLQVVVYSKNNNEIEPGNLNSITKGSEVIAYQTTWSYNFIIVIK